MSTRSLLDLLYCHVRGGSSPGAGALVPRAADPAEDRLVLSTEAIRRLLPGDLLVVKYAGHDWWHERLILYPVTQGPLARTVVYTADGDMYDEVMQDYERSYVISGQAAYPGDAGDAEIRQFGSPVGDKEFLGLHRRAADYARACWVAEGLTPLTRPLTAVAWDGRTMILPHEGHLAGVARKFSKQKEVRRAPRPAAKPAAKAAVPVLPVEDDEPPLAPPKGAPGSEGQDKNAGIFGTGVRRLGGFPGGSRRSWSGKGLGDH